MAMSVYAGTTLIEAEKIIAGDYSAFDWRERVTYSRGLSRYESSDSGRGERAW